MKVNVTRRVVPAIAAATLIGGVAGISGTATASPARARQKVAHTKTHKARHLTDVRVGTLPIIDDAPIYVGMRHGFFARHGIKVTPVPAESGSDIIPAVLSGSEQFGFSNNTSLVVASSKGLPLTIVSGALTAGTSKASGYSELLVKKSSPIHSMHQLAGKTIAVNALGNVGPLSINYALQKSGVNPSSVHFEEIPFPSMDAALQKGSVQVIWDIEPFIGVLKAEKFPFRAIGNTMAFVSPHFPVSSYFTTTNELHHHHHLVVAFTRALDESLAYCHRHLGAVAAALPTYTKITPKLEKFLVYPTFTNLPFVPVIRKTAKLARKYHYTTSNPHWSTLFAGLKKG